MQRTKLRMGPLLFAGLMISIAAVFVSRPVLAQNPGQNSGLDTPLAAWEGKPVLRIEFEGVASARLAALPAQLAQQPNSPLRAENVRQSLRRLYATGLYDNISAEGRLESGRSGIVLIFHGEPRSFIGMVTVQGAKGANTNALLVQTSRLKPGTRFTVASLDRAEAAMRHSLAANGFYEPVFTHRLTPHPADQLVDIAFDVVSGPQARTGEVTVSGGVPALFKAEAGQAHRSRHFREGAEWG
jgi:outer membrane protein insertion porin family